MTLACSLATKESTTPRIFKLVCFSTFQWRIILYISNLYFILILLTRIICRYSARCIFLFYLEIVIVECALVAMCWICLCRRYSCDFIALGIWWVSTASWRYSYLWAALDIFDVITADSFWPEHFLSVEICALSHGFALSVARYFWGLHVAGWGWRQATAVSRRLDCLEDVLAARLAWFGRRAFRYIRLILRTWKDIIVCLKLRRNIKLIFHILLKVVTPVAFCYHWFRDFALNVVHCSGRRHQREMIRVNLLERLFITNAWQYRFYEFIIELKEQLLSVLLLRERVDIASLPATLCILLFDFHLAGLPDPRILE